MKAEERLQTYNMQINEDHSLSWSDRGKDTFNKLAKIANKIVELEGTVYLDKNFDPSYFYGTVKVRLPPASVSKISKLPEVKSLRQTR